MSIMTTLKKIKHETNYFGLLFFILILHKNEINCSEITAERKPNVIMIVADDLGWNDVGFHGLSDIPTPNIDALAYSGIILNNYYVNPLCTPSRSALLTGKYPIHTGMQHGILRAVEPRGLPLTEKLLPEYLKEFKYQNHIVGKWHLGSYKKEYTPTFRGFDSHTGFWNGHHDYFDHTCGNPDGIWGLDMRRNMSVAKDLQGAYSTDIFTNEAMNLIRNHDINYPLFLYLSHAAVHSGSSYNPLPAPDSYVARFDYIKNYTRRRFAAMLAKLDESVGDVIHSLSEKNMLENSIIIFTSDNGGASEGFNMNAASNYPLRGVKSTLWEGGIRGSGFIWSTLLNKTERVSQQMMHITDWLPTILHVVAGNSSNSSNTSHLDGVNMWEALSEDIDSPRKEILHNIDDIDRTAAISYGPWKYISGELYRGRWSRWFGPSGRECEYNFTLVQTSKANKVLTKLKRNVDLKIMERLRENSTVSCINDTQSFSECKPTEKPCLFNIDRDPCEKFNVADTNPEMVDILQKKLAVYNQTAIRAGNLPGDPRGNPKYWDYIWVNYGDYIS